MKTLALSLLIALTGNPAFAQTAKYRSETVRVPTKQTPEEQNLAKSDPSLRKGLSLKKSSTAVHVPIQTKNLPTHPTLDSDFVLRKELLKNFKIGGGDAGGGNLFAGRPLEDYQININNSIELKEAFRQVGNILLNENGATSILKHIVENKSWYVIPAELPRLSGKDIGVEFNVEQGALQDFSEIWISGSEFSNMTSDQKTKLLVHEILMGFAIFKNESFVKQCSVLNREDCTQYSSSQDRMRLSLSLSADDYKAIRNAVNIITQSAASIDNDQTRKELQMRLFSNGNFDSYFYSLSDMGAPTKYFSAQDVEFILKAQEKRTLYCGYEVIENLDNSLVRMRAKKIANVRSQVDGTNLNLQVQLKNISNGKIVALLRYTLKHEGQTTFLSNNKIIGSSYGFISSGVRAGNNKERSSFATFGLAGSKISNMILVDYTRGADDSINPNTFTFDAICGPQAEILCQGDCSLPEYN